ncbi:hypothetical protein [Brevibacterium oceani]|uniref:hypothetical protein n=1 Tax=Brevibacterium oceani TaxID=358099 RepID=UPI001B31A3C4|nr:hypothetical protein [Brevibacterium oceani]
MRILFQGAGAIGLAGAALFTDAHEVAVVSRRPAPWPRAAYPRRVSVIDPSGDQRPVGPGNGGSGDGGPIDRGSGEGVPGSGRSGDGRPGDSGPVNDRSGAQLRAHADGDTSAEAAPGWSVTRVAATRRVTITDWDRAREAGPWDLTVLSTRPCDLDPTVASAIRQISAPVIAITSQVDGDLDRARTQFPDAEVVVFGPAFVSERVADGDAATGHEVRYWAPPAAPRFLVSGRRETVKRLVRELGRLVMPVPPSAIALPPTVFIPYVAELSIRGGSWVQLKSHLNRPARAAAEAVRARSGLPLPLSASVAKAVSAPVARAVLETMEAVLPIDVTIYAGRHFGRHVGQTRDMLTGWATRASATTALREQIAALDAAVAVD